jgi:hypothetical protein
MEMLASHGKDVMTSVLSECRVAPGRPIEESQAVRPQLRALPCPMN